MLVAPYFAASAPSIDRLTRRALGTLVAAAAVLVSGGVYLGLAQTAPTRAILADGNAVVTGFSGVQLPALIKPGVDPAEKTSIDLNGASLRVIDLQAPGAPPRAQVLTAPKPFTVTASQVGQVFGVALDNATPPNIYVAATSLYGLPIVVPDADGDGVPDRWEEGTANARFMPGLFGPAALGGGPGSIWRIDGASGAVRLFANVTFGGAPNSGAALGGLAFDPASNTLLVADRETGMIHRFDSAGRERGRYDHGTQGRRAAGLPAVPFDPGKRVTITRPPFQPANPASWGYAPPPRRVFGLALRGGRLYYAVAEGLQIWSVAIAPDGAFGSDARVELTVPPGPSASEISRVAFDDQGRMLLAERVAPSGAFDFAALTEDGAGRVLRYASAASAGGPAWSPAFDEYAIGFPAPLRNGNGGLAVGYGYDAAGRLDRNACGGFLWSSGERLRLSDDRALAAALARGGAAPVNGLQGNGIDLVRPANAPPRQSYFVDYDDRSDDPKARGHLGDVAIWRVCARAGVGELPWPLPPALLQLPGMPGAPAIPGVAPAPVPPGPPGLPPGGPPLIPAPPGLPPVPPLPPGAQACPVGTHQQPGAQCCPLYMKPGPTGQCQSPCPDGTTDPFAMVICLQGFALPPPNTLINPATLKCLDGSKPVGGLGAWGAVGKCPAPKDAACPVGQVKVAKAGLWSDADCQPISQQQCQGTEQVGLDGKCHQLCPAPAAGQAPQWAWSITQCCPIGTMAGPDGKCAAPGQPPAPPGGPAQVIPPAALPVEPAVPAVPGVPQPPGGPPAVPLACPAGQVIKAGFTCCALGMSLGADGKCQTPCANGDTNATSVQICWRGFQPPADPAKFDPSKATCWNGSQPKHVGTGSDWNNYKCPAPPNATCNPGSQKVASTTNPADDLWADADCALIPEWGKCGPGFLGLDGKCYDKPCPLGQVGFPGYQCCPDGSTVGPDGKCAPPAGPAQVIPPATLPAAPPPAQVAPPEWLAEVPPGVTLTCPAGQAIQPTLKCCPLYMHVDSNGQCQSPCPNGAKDPVSVKACHFGYAAPSDPVSFNPMTSPCWDGSKPTVQAVPGGGVNAVCPAPKNAACSVGYTKVPPPKSFQSLVLTWSDATCEPTAQQQLCPTGQQVGFDAKCQQLCAADERAWLTGQCCPVGAAVSPDGKCVVPHKLPLSVPPSPPKPADPVVCAPGYVKTKSGECCLPSQMTADGKCASPWLPGKAEPPKAADPSACAAGYVKTPDGACCLAGQMTVGGVCCPLPSKPDARRQTCARPAPGITPPFPLPALVECPKDSVRSASGECCPRSQMTIGGQCCPPGTKPDSRRRACVQQLPLSPPMTKGAPSAPPKLKERPGLPPSEKILPIPPQPKQLPPAVQRPPTWQSRPGLPPTTPVEQIKPKPLPVQPTPQVKPSLQVKPPPLKVQPLRPGVLQPLQPKPKID